MSKFKILKKFSSKNLQKISRFLKISLFQSFNDQNTRNWKDFLMKMLFLGQKLSKQMHLGPKISQYFLAFECLSVFERVFFDLETIIDRFGLFFGSIITVFANPTSEPLNPFS